MGRRYVKGEVAFIPLPSPFFELVTQTHVADAQPRNELPTLHFINDNLLIFIKAEACSFTPQLLPPPLPTFIRQRVVARPIRVLK